MVILVSAALEVVAQLTIVACSQCSHTQSVSFHSHRQRNTALHCPTALSRPPRMKFGMKSYLSQSIPHSFAVVKCVNGPWKIK